MNETWLNLTQWALGSFVAVMLWSLRTAIKGGYWLKSGESLKHEFVELENRFDRASAKMSTLASTVQGLPDQIRRESDDRYMSAELSEERWAEARRHIATLDDRLRNLEIEQARLRGRARGD